MNSSSGSVSSRPGRRLRLFISSRIAAMRRNSERSSTLMGIDSSRSAATNSSTMGPRGTFRMSTSWVEIIWRSSSTGPLKDGVVTTKVTAPAYFVGERGLHVELHDESSLGHAALRHVAPRQLPRRAQTVGRGPERRRLLLRRRPARAHARDRARDVAPPVLRTDRDLHGGRARPRRLLDL